MNLHEQDAAAMDIKTDYNDFINIIGRNVGPLNYAPPTDATNFYYDYDTLLPINRLKHLPSPKKDDCKLTLSPSKH